MIRAVGIVERRQGERRLRPERRGPGQGACGRRTRLAGVSPGDGRAGRGARHGDEGRRRDRAGGPGRGLPAARGRGDLVRPGVGQVADRPHQGGGGRGGPDQGGAGAAPQGLAADDQGRRGRSTAPAPGRSPFYLNTEARPWLPRPDHPRRAAVSAFGFGGSNFHCVLEEAEPEPSRRSTGTATSRSSPSRPTGPTRSLAALDAWPGRPGLGRAPGRGRPVARRVPARRPAPARRSSSSATGPTWPTLLGRGPRRSLAGPRPQRPRRAEGVFVGDGPDAGRAGDALPRPGVAVRRDAPRAGLPVPRRCTRPWPRPTRAALDDGRRLGDLDLSRTRRSTTTSRARHERRPAGDRGRPAGDRGGQPGGLLRVLEHFGVRPDAVAGHSFGELTALCAAGRIDDAALVDAGPAPRAG